MQSVSYIVVFLVVWFALMKGNEFYVNHKMMTDYTEKVEFLIKNNAANGEVCSAIDSVIRWATTTQNQEKYDEYQKMAKERYCL